MKVHLGIAAAALSLLMLAGCASAPASPTTVTKEAPAVVLTVTATATTDATANEAATTADPTTVDSTEPEFPTPADIYTPEVASEDSTPAELTTEPPAAAAPAGSTMPDMTGTGLQSAQDQMQALTGNPMFVSGSTDATGAGRSQVMDSNWQVCSQTPGPGTKIAVDSVVSFAAVKLSESCP